MNDLSSVHLSSPALTLTCSQQEPDDLFWLLCALAADNLRSKGLKWAKDVIKPARQAIPEEIGSSDPNDLAEAEEDFKKKYIREVLELNNWNKAETARDLGVDPRTIFRYIEKFDE